MGAVHPGRQNCIYAQKIWKGRKHFEGKKFFTVGKIIRKEIFRGKKEWQQGGKIRASTKKGGQKSMGL